MEMTKYSMWTEQRRGLAAPHLKPGSIYDDSWEEQAFAEDAAGALGGCIWPPRSYSCSFCRREFRSAQALGGHMNVHRRDRARLKQSPIPHSEVLHSDHQNHHNPIEPSFAPFKFRYQSHQVYNALFYNPNPNSDPGAPLSSNSPPACGVSSDPPQESNRSKKISICPFSSSIVNDENPRKISISSPIEPSLAAEDYCHIDRPMSRPHIVDQEHRAKRDHLVGTKLPTRLNLFVRTMPTQEMAEKDDKRCSKKRKVDQDTSRTAFLLRSTGVVRDRFRPLEAHEQSPSPKEELDLELRLGCPPKVKLQN